MRLSPLTLAMGLATSFDTRYAAQRPRQYVCYYTTGLDPDRVDGDLTKEAWAEVPFTEDFVDIKTPTAPRFRTRAKMRYDDAYLYVGAELCESNIWGTLPSDAVIFGDNDFEVFVDTDGTTHNYKEYEVNALGSDWTLLLDRPYADGGSENSTRVAGAAGFSLEGLRRGVKVYPAGALNDPSVRGDRWTVEIALPIAGLLSGTGGSRPRDGAFWRINFSRVEWNCTVVDGEYVKNASCQSCEAPGSPLEDNWVWSPQGQVAMHLPERWGILQFSEEPPGKATLKDYAQWPSRAAAMALYYAEHRYFAARGAFTESVEELKAFEDPDFPVCAAAQTDVTLSVRGEEPWFTATVQSPDGAPFAATVEKDRYLTVAGGAGGAAEASSRRAQK